LVTRLEKENIIVGVRDIFSKKIVRASPHFFNTESEIQIMVDAIKKV
jgi:cysteine desulfurase/selenocysteine lyase